MRHENRQKLREALSTLQASKDSARASVDGTHALAVKRVEELLLEVLVDEQKQAPRAAA